MTMREGEYAWGAYCHSELPEVSLSYKFRDIALGASSYTWTDCLKPMNGYYIHTSQLDPDNPAWHTATVSRNLRLTNSGRTAWGSILYGQS
ncbi:hypothetical protein OG555_24500 [Kribbella sp. NBC_01484]|uniref:hypothetical protein n=1 Tax=Kribbella sp. NBC_01484 TaxID=2903579 RepID=UPI002E366F5D|nr:hypothetical protein [Kribbella sp. NBC_01484]